jgi:hypothetical protein
MEVHTDSSSKAGLVRLGTVLVLYVNSRGSVVTNIKLLVHVVFYEEFRQEVTILQTPGMLFKQFLEVHAICLFEA